MKMFWVVALFLVILISAWMVTGRYYEHFCLESPEDDVIRVGFRNPLGLGRVITFGGSDKVLFIESWKGKSAWSWENMKAIHLSSRDWSNETLISVEMEKPGSETTMLEGGYVNDNCLRKIVTRFGSRIKVIKSRH